MIQHSVVDANAAIDLVPTVNWGRKAKAQLKNSVGALIIVAVCPVLVTLNWIALEHFEGSITFAIYRLISQGPLPFIGRYAPRVSSTAVAGYSMWYMLQVMLYEFLPGPRSFGQRTPGGNLHYYTTNGLMAWCITHLAFLSASVLGFMDPSLIARHWQGLVVTMNLYGFTLAFLAQLKGYFAPSFPEDRKTSGSWIFDFWAGVELNPRIGKSWDVKFFHIGRPSMLSWTVIDLSFAAYQYQTVGRVTPSMLIVLALHTIYVVDFFFNEDWYLRTIDISHDHFGFMLAWGSTTFLPTLYTLQAQYLARHSDIQLTNIQSLGIMTFGLVGYWIFREANHQRDYARAQQGRGKIWGRSPTVIPCSYNTSDGKEYKTLLLASGWWGVARHANYMGDLMLTWSMCATCGVTHFIPWSYFLFMCILLYHRAVRDERRCRNKYGKYWEQYCNLVPYRIIPGVY